MGGINDDVGWKGLIPDLPARNAYAFKSGHLLPAFASPLTEWRDAAPIFRGPQLRKPILPHTRPSDAENPTTAAGLNKAHKLDLQGPLCASITTGRHSDDDQT